jgi:hypothetical protein
LTTALNYGVIGPDGDVDVRIIYDHRVLDGATVARALVDLEAVLSQEVFAELRRSTEISQVASRGRQVPEKGPLVVANNAASS